MTPAQTLNTLSVEGFQLSPRGEGVAVTGDLTRLTPELRESIRDNRDELLRLLEAAEERTAIQQESLATADDLSWPTFADVANRQLPPGWAITEWQPALSIASPTPYADSLEAAGVEITRCAGHCERCGSRQAYLQAVQCDSLRRDCANCGRFEEFAAWCDRQAVERVLASLQLS